MRIQDWRWTFIFLLICAILESCFSATNTTTPLYQHEDPRVEREFQNVYQTAARSPGIFTGANAPAFTPVKVGDIYISTSTSHIYTATATVNSASWLLVK